MGGNSQNLQIVSVAYPTSNLYPVLSPPANKQLQIHSVIATNNTEVDNNVGLGVLVPAHMWKLHSADGTDITDSIQLGETTDIFTTDDNDGILVVSKDRFNGIALTIDQAETGTPVYEYRYWNGTTWVALPTLDTPVYTGDAAYVAFTSPLDWEQGSGGAVDSFDGVNTGYAIRIRATTAPTQAVRATSLGVMKFFANRLLTARQFMEVSFPSHKPYLLNAGEAIIPYFGVAGSTNTVEVAYQVLQ